YRSPINQRIAPCGDHLCRRWIPDDAPEPELAESRRRHLGVGDGPVVDHHHLRSDDRLSWAPSPRARPIAAIPELVWLPLEDVENLLVDVAAAVVPDINDDSFLLPEAIDLVLKALERRLIHRANVDVRDLAICRLVHRIAVV